MSMRLGLFIQVEDPKMWLVVDGAIAAARHQKTQLVVYAGPSEQNHALLDRKIAESAYGFSRKEHAGVGFAFAAEKCLRYAQELWAEGTPTMLIGRHAGAVPFTANNHQDTMRRSVRLLTEKGHQRIAFLAGPSANLSAAEKQAGYMQGLAQNSIQFDPALLLQGDYTEETGCDVVAAALSAGLEFSALIASNDLSAIGAMTAMRSAGLAPGGDIEILGFDNIPRTHWVRPPLSTYDPHYYQMGHKACTELAACAAGRNYIVSTTVPAVYIPRESTWEPASGNEMDHPLNADWLENKFMYEAQLGLLKQEPEAAAMIEQLPALMQSKESFLQTFHELIREVRSLGLSAGCLFPVLLGCMRAAGGKAKAGAIVSALLREACAVQTTVLFDEERRMTDRANRYASATHRLRQLSLSDVKEDAIMQCMGTTFTTLGIQNAGIFLHDHPARLGEERGGSGRWFSWCDGTSHTMHNADAFSFELMERQPEAIIYLPLIENQEFIGIMLLDGTNEFLANFSTLSRQFSAVLRAARLQRDLARAGAELVETSRMAGLAEMATGVLHNIGNALNGVNTNCSLMADRLRKSHVHSVPRLAELLRRHATNLAAFLTEDPKGRQVPAFVTQLGDQLEAEHSNLQADLTELHAMVEHINEIVAAQQSYAQISGVVEDVQPHELLEFALRLGEASLTRHMVQIERHYEDVSEVRIQRQKAVQILVNLVRNAKESMDLARCEHKILTMSVRHGATGRVVIEVKDNGLGIPPEHLSRIFNFGFTTKPGGHGFGLHNCALAAREMGGSLTVHSDGPGCGATFQLDLPASSRRPE